LVDAMPDGAARDQSLGEESRQKGSRAARALECATNQRHCGNRRAIRPAFPRHRARSVATAIAVSSREGATAVLSNKNVVVAAVAVAALLMLAMKADAQVPRLLTYQGLLTGSGGTPVNGSVQMTFSSTRQPRAAARCTPNPNP
jgi:hypothetical protein